MPLINAHIPLIQILAKIPIVFLIGALPITPGGLGTTNVAMIELLAPHLSGDIFATSNITPAELILSVSLLWMFVNYFLKVLVGLFFLRRVSQDIFQAKEASQPLQSVENITP